MAVCREILNNSKTLRGILAAQEIHGVEGGGVNSTRPLFEAYMNPFLGAIHRAYEAHFPIVLGPDEVWTCIAQGFAMHINENAETLRKRFVQHEGQKKLVVHLPFTKGDPDAPWSSALSCFSDAIAENLGPKQRELVVSNFSTTGPIERAASEIVLMGAMQKFFSYYGVTLCGIPEITLLGTTEDWKSVRDRASALAEYDLEWWTRELLPILDQFIAASEGRVDADFWKSIYKVQGGSGGPYISGWIVDLFPYLTKGHDGTQWRDAPVRNPFLGGATRGIRRGPTTDGFPMGLTRVAWDWNYLGTMFDMEFLGGFVGYTQDPDTYALRPALGWAVRDTKAPTPSRTRRY